MPSEFVASVKYVVVDDPSESESGLKRMTYYTYLPSRPGEYYFGFSFRIPESNESLERMVKNKQIIELSPTIPLTQEKDLYLDYEGQIILASGYSPLSDENRRIVATPKELSRARMLLNRALAGKELPKIHKSHTIN